MRLRVRGGPWPDAELRWALRFVFPYRRKLGLVLALSLLSTLVALGLPYLSKILVDEALIGRSMPALLWVAALWLGLTVLNFLLNLVSGLTYTAASAAVLFDMRLALYQHLQALSPRFYARTPLGEIVSRINNDIGEIQRVVSDSALAWIGHVFFLVGSVSVMIWLDARLFFIGILLLPASVVALRRYRVKLETSLTDLRARSAEIGSFLIETLQAVRLTVSSGAQQREATRFRARNDAFVAALMRMQWLRYLSGGLPGLLVAASTALVFLYGGSRVISGEMTLGTFVAFMAYQMRLTGPVQGLMGLYANLATVRVSLRRVHDLLETPAEVREHPTARRLPRVKGDVVFERVTFAFDGRAAVLDGVDLQIRPGETVAIVGASGSGKSTLADLLQRQIEPDSGRILLDGVDLRSVKLEDLRRQVAAVEQEPFLFHAELGENVRYAVPSATDAEVCAALEAAGLGGLLRALPAGLATVVGERGRALSTGERQRVALARALLTASPILVLDEPTSAMDPASESMAIRGYGGGLRVRTVIVVTHRLEVARHADRVIMLKSGKVFRELAGRDLWLEPDRFRGLFVAEPPVLHPEPA